MSAVVSGSRRRFTRRRRWRRARPMVVLLVLAGLVGLGWWTIWFSDLLSVRTVSVHGTETVPARRVEAVAEVPMGTPLAQLDTDAIGDRVADIPGVGEVHVVRSWPSTLRIVVTERIAVAGVDSGGQWWLIDGDGVLFQQVDGPPEDLPRLEVAVPDPEDEATAAALTVLDGLPEELLGVVSVIMAETAQSVELVLDDGRRVVWGGADRGNAKARVLRPLLEREGEVFDVSSPSVVVVR